MKPVEIVTIKKLSPIYKEGEIATNIELVNLEETGYEIIAQKGLYEVGDSAVYIQPDYCLPDNIPLFESFIKPGGDPKKSRLGKNNRIRAIKFNFSKKGETDPIYSMGILLPYKEVYNFLNPNQDDMEELYKLDLVNKLQIIKYEEPETGHTGHKKGGLPVGMYKTDEDNFENQISKLKFPCKLVGTKKVDGSSITIFINDKGESGICSRSFEKKLEAKEVVGYESPIGEKVRKHFDRNINTLGWLNESTGDFFTEVPKNYKQITKEVKDTWVELGKPILEKIKSTGLATAVRGEIVGQGLKGSGNKNNPDKNINQTLFVYGVDSYLTGVTKKLPMNDVIDYCRVHDLNMVPIIFNKTFRSEKTLRKACNDYFKNNLIEGIVIRSLEDTSFSAKFMNPQYDSLK